MTQHSGEFLRRANDARQRITEVLPAEARKRVAEGALLLDVRDKEAFEAGHIKGAMNISRGSLEMRIGEVQKMGYTQVVSIEGGLNAYEPDEKS